MLNISMTSAEKNVHGRKVAGIRFFSGVLSFSIIFLVITLAGCGNNASTASSKPNPAAEKCLRDGFELKPIVVGGVPREYHCVDPRSGKSCEVWKYYRHECDILPAAPEIKKEGAPD